MEARFSDLSLSEITQERASDATMLKLTMLFSLLLAPCAAFQAPTTSVRSALTTSRAATTMGPFDFLAFGQAGARHILLSDRGKANFLKQQIEEGKMSFAAVAKEYSTCPSASKGGDVSAAS